MKKQILLILLPCILLSLISGCTEKHQATGWDSDLTSHWQICEECGEIVKHGEHKLNSIGNCSICGATVYEDDDFAVVYINDDMGNLIKDLMYDGQRNVIQVRTYEYEYDENGNVVKSSEYYDGVLSREDYYTITDEGSVLEKSIYSTDDGRVYTDFYSLNSNGEFYVSTNIQENQDGEIIAIVEYDEMDRTTKLTTYATETSDQGSTRVITLEEEYTYNEKGERIASTTYQDGVLLSVETYKYLEDGYMYTDTFTMYSNYNGTKTVLVFDEDYNVISSTTYDANGNETNE